MFYEGSTNRGNTQLFPPEYFLFNLTLPSCTSVVFYDKDVQSFTPWPEHKGAFRSPYFLSVLTFTDRACACVTKPQKMPRRMRVGCIAVFQTGVAPSVCSPSMQER